MPECAEDLEGLAFPVSEDFCYGKIMRCGLFIMKSPWSVSVFFFFFLIAFLLTKSKWTLKSNKFC